MLFATLYPFVMTTKLKLARLNDGPEIFYTIQGEGKNLGFPSIFVRLSLCNLYCVWCDTDYTWNWQHTPYPHLRDTEPGYQKYDKAQHIVMMEVEALMEAVGQHPCKHVVITGGEPLVQHKALLPFAQRLKSEGYFIEYETNGTIIPNEALDIYSDQYNVSIKLSNAGVLTEERIRPEAISFFAQSSKSYFKFVVDSPQDLSEVLDLVQNYDIPSDKVYLMPQGTSQALLRQKQQWLVALCKEQGFRYTDRLHIHIYGDKRGV